MLICQRTVNHSNIWNEPLYTLMCPLQIINWHWTPSWCNPLPIQCRKLLNGPKVGNRSTKLKKMVFQVTYFYTSLQIFGSKFKIPIATERGQFFDIQKIGTLQPTKWPSGPVVIFSKIQNRLGRALSAPPMDRFVMDNLNNKCTIIPY